MSGGTTSCSDEDLSPPLIHSRTPSDSDQSAVSASAGEVVLSIANLTGNGSQATKAPPTLADFESLKSDLASAQKCLTEKDAEISRLSKIRDEVERELEELTASLFTEAHKMVREANVKQASAEKSANEAKMQIDGLTTEVAALKVMVLTSTPSHPNRHLHPQIDPKSSKSNPSSPRNAQPTTENSDLPEESKLNIDPIFRKDYLNWKKVPSLIIEDHAFLKRIYEEDINPTLRFSGDPVVEAKIYKAIHDNTLSISPISKDEMESKKCALIQTPMLCKYRMKFSLNEEEEESFDICQLSRNRIISVCDCLNYLRYVTQGLVKSHANDVYWEIMQLRKKILMARLGFNPD